MDQLLEEVYAILRQLHNPEIASNKDMDTFCCSTVDDRLTQSHKVSIGGTIRLLILDGKQEDKALHCKTSGHHAHTVVYGDRFLYRYVELWHLNILGSMVAQSCHRRHGLSSWNGTEDIYWNDPDTLVISFHQDGRTLYPGTGDVHESGGPAAYGYNVNIPLPPQTGEEGFLYVLDNVVMPILDEYQPDLIINSAGQDNHYSDPITNMNFTAHAMLS